MEASQEIISKIKLLLGEPYSGGLFAEEELASIVEEASSLEEALYIGWTLKATKVMALGDGVASVSIGAESISFTSPSEYSNYCLTMAKVYQELLPKKTGGSRALSLEPPIIEGIGDDDGDFD